MYTMLSAYLTNERYQANRICCKLVHRSNGEVKGNKNINNASWLSADLSLCLTMFPLLKRRGYNSRKSLFPFVLPREADDELRPRGQQAGTRKSPLHAPHPASLPLSIGALQPRPCIIIHRTILGTSLADYAEETLVNSEYKIR